MYRVNVLIAYLQECSALGKWKSSTVLRHIQTSVTQQEQCFITLSLLILPHFHLQSTFRWTALTLQSFPQFGHLTIVSVTWTKHSTVAYFPWSLRFSLLTLNSPNILVIVCLNEEQKYNKKAFFCYDDHMDTWITQPNGISNCVICLETSTGLRGNARWMSSCKLQL